MNKWLPRERISESETDLFKYYPEIVARALFHRGIKSANDARVFFDPKYEEDMHDPFLMTDMMKATLRIIAAIKNKERIVIYGDYDCDGISASAVLDGFFKKIEYTNYEVYIPHRNDEGYGLNIESVQELCSRGADLFITVDCGIADIEPVREIKRLGADVIITDHHEPKEILPDAFAVVDPKREGDKYPCKMISGSGVAFKLVQALLILGDFKVGQGWEKWLLDMAGLGTISDMVPLQGENRIFASFGLAVLQRTKRPGLQNLYRKARINGSKITEEDVGFAIAPRINAAGRIGVPSIAFTFISSDDPVEASLAFDYLEAKNIERKKVVQEIMNDARLIANNMNDKKVLFIGNENWAAGILGLIAGRVADEYKKSVFVWGGCGDSVKGSCRSDGSVSLVNMMSALPEDVFSEFGGHHLAGGFALKSSSIDGAHDALEEAYSNIAEEKIAPEIIIDEKLNLEDITWGLYDSIEKMAPFGMGNPRPNFLFENVQIKEVKLFGKSKDHLQLELIKGDGKTISAYDFFKNKESFEGVSLGTGSHIDLVATIEKNSFGRYPTLRLKIVDIKNSN